MSKKQPQMNGAKYIDSIDVDDPEYVREMRRPVEVKQDVRQMEERRRVQLILKSKAFRHELEEIVVEQLKTGPAASTQAQGEAGGTSPDTTADLFPAQSRLRKTATGSVVPIADFSGEDVSGYDRGEKLLRCKLAACCRLIDIFGWSQGDQSYITVREGAEHFLAVAQGLQYRELTAASLIKLNERGQVVHQGSTSLAINHSDFSLNAAVHLARPGIKCVIFLCNPSAFAVSSMDCGLLPLCQDAMALGDVKFSDYFGGGDGAEMDKVGEAFGSTNKVLFLRNAGVVIGGESIEEAFHIARSVMNAIDTQLRTLPLGLENIHLPSEATRKRAYERANRAGSVGGPGEEGKRRWGRGELEFEALMRHLENSGYKTGYVFHAPLVRQAERLDRVNSEVEVPPASTSFAYAEGDASSSVLRERQKKGLKTDYLNSPNAYKKEELEEKGAPHPKKITKWVPDGAPGTLIKIENPNQFAPIGTDPKELKAKFHEIRKDHYDENITAGPQSRILEGVTWEEAQRIKEGHVASDTIIVVGAASRGIIKRDHQAGASVYKTYYAPNPFDNMTEEEVEEYRAEINRKTKRADSRGLTTEEEEGGVIVPGPDGRLISSEERMEQVRQVQAEAAAGGTSPTPPAAGGGRGTPEVKLSISTAAVPPQQTVAKPAQDPVPSPKAIMKPEQAVLRSPTKSTSSGEGTHGDRSGTDAGTGREQDDTPTPAGAEKKKKKRGFRMPSFSSKKKDKQ